MIARIPLKVTNTVNNEEINVALVAVSVEELNELEMKLQCLEQVAQPVVGPVRAALISAKESNGKS